MKMNLTRWLLAGTLLALIVLVLLPKAEVYEKFNGDSDEGGEGGKKQAGQQVGPVRQPLPPPPPPPVPPEGELGGGWWSDIHGDPHPPPPVPPPVAEPPRPGGTGAGGGGPVPPRGPGIIGQGISPEEYERLKQDIIRRYCEVYVKWAKAMDEMQNRLRDIALGIDVYPPAMLNNEGEDAVAAGMAQNVQNLANQMGQIENEGGGVGLSGQALNAAGAACMTAEEHSAPGNPLGGGR